ncbi:hypothetical protein J3Q64DRAFT_1872381 [Phycomyces blakesleeanus]|uniref:Actin-like ATPase domain-containing protein n=2 Tax=Phycomyces blakesleeanus TaxID=4837 RepID=A0A163DH25_PHYB8|nr:hypothetical protein PHYBLDRAFT_187705 [Phycomyces blakesleeanus NRRL 1555(-)]OAD71190.1 hypothetical protein PHYBLDRAFT_187705 [Phycomyces blakesleeanus NRRL 1555(-)]|eukprot:XP_018289230.1 hypothetical protein PHYBLDRAFT_187705 [Phycomyces blakesleeanus NRRL 1555(-)]
MLSYLTSGKNNSNNTSEYDFLIAIDFGTTCSGFDVVNLNEPIPKIANPNDVFNKVKCCKRAWRSKCMESEMLYSPHRRALVKYGKEADEYRRKYPSYGYDYVSKVKLLLDKTIQNECRPSIPSDMTPLTIIADFLEKIYKYIKKDIYKVYPKYYTSKYRYCLTVPTMWTDESRDLMRKAAVKAGLISEHDEPDRLFIVDEAVAAALYAERNTSGPKLTDGQSYMICDAGGGTVDIAVFEKNVLSEKTCYKEITIGTGRSCGSTFLDGRFKALMEDNLYRYPEYSEEDIEPALYKFTNNIKKRLSDPVSKFEPETREMRNDKHNGPTFAGEFSYDEIREEVFDPVVREVLEIIEKQFSQLGERRLDVMFITGGFGSSPYLQHRIKETFKDRVKHFEVVRFGTLAVMEGALLYGIDRNIVTQHASRRTYGIMLCTPSQAFSNPGPSKCKFDVCITKGDPILKDKWISKELNLENNQYSTMSVFAYDGDDPIPEYPTEEEVNPVAIYNIGFKFGDGESGLNKNLEIKMRFGLDRVEVKAAVAAKAFRYKTLLDVSGEITELPFLNPEPVIVDTSSDFLY